MRQQLIPAVRTVAVLTLILGLLYPLAMTGVAQVLFADKANGSLVKVDGKVVGSRLVGQEFTEARYFHGRPSAAGAGASGSLVVATDADGNERQNPDGSPMMVPAETADLSNNLSGSSNLGPTNPELIDSVADRVAEYRKENGLPQNAKVPVDAVTASGSGLDPHISPANAKLQADRVAERRRMPVGEVLSLIRAHTEARPLGFLGEPGVNVLELNLALDRAS